MENMKKKKQNESLWENKINRYLRSDNINANLC